MFGDTLILGEHIGKICDKGRIFIPSFANPERQDEIVLQPLQYENNLALKIWSFNECLKIIQRIQNLRDKSTSLDEYNRCTEEIERFSMLMKKRGFLDSEKRIMIPKSLMDELNWAPHDQIIFNGLGESSLIRKREQNK